MGKIFSSIFGGSGQKQQSQQQSQSTSDSSQASWNNAYPDLQKSLSPDVQNGGGANDFIASLLGLNGNQAANDGFNQYKNSTGYNFMMDSGTKALDAGAASKGLLDSGSEAKALTQFGQNTGSQYFGNYLSQLLGLGNQGVAAGGVLSDAGKQSTGTSTSQSTGSGTSSGSGYSKQGMGSFLGQMAKGMAGG